MTDEKPAYTEENIQRINPVEHVRLRPGMYIGGTNSRALHHLIYNILDDAVDEKLAGFIDHIWITLRSNQEVTIRHNGRGIPLQPERNGKTLLEVLMTETGIWRNANYEIRSMMHGNLVYAVNALSTEFKVESACDGFLWQQTYREGVSQSEVIQVRQLEAHESTGLTITFRPDFTIMEPNKFDYETLANRAQELAYLVPDLTITLHDEREADTKSDEYHFSNNLADFITDLNRDKRTLHAPLLERSAWGIPNHGGRDYTIQAAVAFQYIDSLETSIIGFANTLRTNRGFHTDIIPMAIVTTINNRIADLNLQLVFSIEEVVAGFNIVVHVIHPHPSFENQTKLVLINPDVAQIVAYSIYQAFQLLNLDQFNSIIEKLLANREALKS